MIALSSEFSDKLAQKDFTGAETALEAAFAGQPKGPDYFYYRAKISEAKGEVAAAYAYASFAAERSEDPEIAREADAIGAKLQASGRTLADLDPATDRLIEFSERVPVSELTLAFAFLTGIGSLIMWLRVRGNRAFGKAAFWTTVFFFITLGGLSVQFWAESHPPVFVVKEGMARTGPGHAFLEVAPVKAGMKLRLIRDGKDWVRLRLGTGTSEGYLPASSVLIWRE